MFYLIKKRAILFVGLVMFLSVGLGCKGPTDPLKAAPPVTLEYWTVFDDVDALQSLLTKYKAERPYLTVNVRQLRADELRQQLIEALAEDRGPDIVSIRNRSIGEYATKLAPLPPSYRDTIVAVSNGTLGKTITVSSPANTSLTPDGLDREYVPAVKKDVTRDGKIYGLPLSFDALALYYNKDLLDKAGIAEPPADWKSLQLDVAKLARFDKKNNKILQAAAALGTGGNLPGSDDLLYILFNQSGLPFTDKAGAPAFNRLGQSNLPGNADDAARVLDFYTDFANPSRDTYTWNEGMENALDAFTHGSLAFFFGYNYHYNLIKARAPQLNFAVAPMIQLDPGNAVNAANYWVEAVTAKSAHQEAAWALINYLAHSGATKEYLAATHRPSARRAYLAEQASDPIVAPFSAQALVAQNWYSGKNYDAALKAINDMIHDWLAGPPNPDQLGQWRTDALNRAAEKINQTL